MAAPPSLLLLVVLLALGVLPLALALDAAVIPTIPIPTCTSYGGSVALNHVPVATECILLYNATWRVSIPAKPAEDGSLTFTDLNGTTVLVQFFSDTGCTQYLDNVLCALQPLPTAPIATATPAAICTPTAAASTTAPTSSTPTDPSTPSATSPAAPANGVVVSAGSPSCDVQDNGVAISVPASTQCVIVYNSGWSTLLSSGVSLGSGSETISNDAMGETAFVEYYSDTECSTFINYVTCTGGSNPPASTATDTPGGHVPTPSSPTQPVATRPPASNSSWSQSRAPKHVRGMYVWMYGNCLFNNIPSGTDYASQCGGVSDYLTYQNNILNNLMNPWGQFPRYNRIYLEMGIDNVVNNAPTVRAFLSKAHAMGFAVDYLDGVKTWVQSTADAAIPMGYCDQLVAFNQGSTNPAEWIDGIQYDIEPHTLGASWRVATPGAPDNYNQVYEANLISIFQHCMSVTRPTNMTVTWSVGNDYYAFVHGLWNAVTGPNPFVDYLTIMNYYSNENSFLYGGSEDGTTNIGGVSNILASLQGTTVPAVFAAETMPPAYAPAWQSFWGIGSAALEKTEADAINIFASNPLFAGVATHWYATYFELPPNSPGNSS